MSATGEPQGDAADDSTARDPLDVLAEQFLDRRRRGERIDVENFVAEHPAHAAGLRDLLPTLVALEQVKRQKESTGSGRARVHLPAMERLGDFRIVRELGRGGMGVVFEAVQESLGRKVALKVLPQASLLKGNQLERFRREAQIAAQLHHSNIVPVFGSGESDGFHWYAMQFIAGGSLDLWREQQAAQPPSGSGAWRNRARFVARIGAQAASALHYAHTQGTMHRDVKPGNLLLEHDEHLWVTDFGLAKALEAEGLTHSGDLLGTLQYMAPEQFAGLYDARSEVYALGVTLYELLVLRPAFAAKSRSELMEKIRTQRPEPLRRSCPEVPEDLAIVVERALARDPADRYADAHALEQDLTAFLEDRPIAARRQSAVGQLVRWCRRNRIVATLAACTLLAVVGVGATGWIYFVDTADLLGKWKQSALVAEQQSSRADTNLRLALAAFGDVFDAMVGRDPLLALEQDEETGEQTFIARTVVDPRSVELLQKMLAFYGEFTAQNAENQALRFETARAHRRVGSIHARLGKPDSLDKARAAYERALLLFEDVNDRPVGREIAAVHVELGQLDQRRGARTEAAQRFLRALGLLETEAARDSRQLQYERAHVHFLLAQLADPSSGSGGPRGPGGPGSLMGGSPGDPRREAGRIVQGARQNQQACLAIVDKLLGEEPGNREFRALKARGLLLRLPGEGMGRVDERPTPGGRRGERARDPAAEAQRLEGLAILRELVEQNPAADGLRFELCNALVDDRRREDRRREGPGRARRDGLAPREAAPPTAEDLAVLREAKRHAEQLVADQPLSVEYQALRGTVGTLLGKALRDQAEALPEAEQAAVRSEARDELVAALGVERGLVAAGEVADPRFLREVVETRRSLASLALASKDRAAALEHVRAMFDLMERQVQLLEARAQDAGDRRDPSPPWLRMRFGEEGGPLLSERILTQLGAPELVERGRRLQERIERLYAPERRGGPPEPRRNGK
jgi:tetratricopeptide (TPR) repeat protein